eukprot:COSAG06_NODE_21804_length_744_cov_2.728682_1_plen_51_part_10
MYPSQASIHTYVDQPKTLPLATVSRPPKCNGQPFRPGHGACNGSSMGAGPL